MYLPECQQPPAKARSKEAPGRSPMQGGRCMWRPHLFSSGVAWTHAGRRFFLVTRTRVSNAVAREPAARIFFSRSDDMAVACFFLRCRAVATAVRWPCAASCGTQRARPVNAQTPTCQSDGADLSPANLSCPGV